MVQESGVEVAKVSDFLRSLFERFGVSKVAWSSVAHLFVSKRLRKNQHLVSPPQVFASFAVITSGLLRIYYVTPAGKETTKTFREPGELIGPFAEILRRSPARTYTQALEPSEVLLAPHAAFVELAERDLAWAHVLRRVAESNYLEKDDREYDLLYLSAEQRYLKLCETRPTWVRKVRQYQLASYLGITPVALSRIRRRLKGR